MRLLPWLGSCFSMTRPLVTDDTSLQLIQVTTCVTVLQNADCLINKSIKVDSAESKMTLQNDQESIPNIYLCYCHLKLW